MLMIILLHTNYFSLGGPTQEDIELEPLSSFWRVFSEQLCIVGVNVFVMISGWFGIKPKTKGLCSLLYQVLFWGAIITIGGILFNVCIPIKSTAKLFWFGSYYWFIIAYIGLYILSPVLNSFIKTASAKEYLVVLIGFFAAEIIYGWIYNSESYYSGYSIISFVGLYLLARFLRLHSKRLLRTKTIKYMVLYLVMTFIPAAISYIGIKNNWPQLRPLYYSSPFVIAASTFLFLSFAKHDFNSRAINWIACSTFSAFLIHLHPIIVPYFQSTMRYLADSFSTLSYTIIVVLFAVAIILASSILDKLRIISWNYISSICLDKIIFRIDSRFENRMEKKHPWSASDK